MKKLKQHISLLCLAILFVLQANAGVTIKAKSANNPNGFAAKSAAGVSFTENKGQVHDQNNKARPDVLFGGTDGNLVFHLKNNGISYQLNRIDVWKEVEDERNKVKRKQIDKSTIYRLDIEWLNANSNTKVTKGKAVEGFDSYYFENCPNGALNVKSFEEITYQNIYSGIDLKWYQKDGHLKYDYLVAAGANYRNIQLQFSGAKSIKLNSKGELVIATPLGNIIEQAPLVIQNNKTLIAKWVIKSNIVSFEIENLNNTLPFIIDPLVRTWGTYYGGAAYDDGYTTRTDAAGNVYLSGATTSNTGTIIATSGAHQSIYGGASFDAYLVKFNSNGVRQWGTYYGGSNNEYGYSHCIDPSGNIYLTGSTASSVGTAIATVGSHQQLFGGVGNDDAFLVKFDANGIRQWGTYYGGSGNDISNSCCTDAAGNVFISGYTSSNTGTVIATAGAHQPVYGGGGNDAFLVKFNTNGVRQWGSYYGGVGNDIGQSCVTDATGNVYLSGSTTSNSGTVIATIGSHQQVYAAGLTDGFLVKFNAIGARQWSTYYGGTGEDNGYNCVIDGAGDIYLSGYTASTSGIATALSHQSIYGGGSYDAFLVKFNTNGVRQWGTYYGGLGADAGSSCSFDNVASIYFSGGTTSNTGTIIATVGSYQATTGGANDLYLAKFDLAGNRIWGTYYGGAGNESSGNCYADAIGNVYLIGLTQSNTGTIIASAGSHQPLYGGGLYDAFLVKFSDCSIPSNPTGINQSICTNNTATLSATSGSATINWFATALSTTILGTGTAYITPTLTVGSYTYYAEAFTCVTSATRTAITVTVNALPIVSVNSGSICSGSSFTINPTGASTYSISGGFAIVSPTTNASYNITGTSAQGCVSSNTAVSSVAVNSLPTITAITNNTLLCTGETTSLTASGASNYLWNTSATTSVIAISPTVTTNYTVNGTDANGCSNSSTITQSVSLCTGISATQSIDASLNVYPNPSNGLFTITGIEQNENISIYNTLGELIKTFQTEKINTTIDLSDNSNGIYFIKIKNSNGEAIHKLIKQ